MMYDVSESIVEEYHGNVDYDDFTLEVLRFLTISCPINHDEYLKLSKQEIAEKLYHSARAAYNRRLETMRSQAMPIIKNVYEQQGKTYENILVPVTDGFKTYNVITHLERNVNNQCEELCAAMKNGKPCNHRRQLEGTPS